jgi:hypothetical protein
MKTYAMTVHWFSEVSSPLQSDPTTVDRLREQFLSFFSTEVARPKVNHRAALLLISAVRLQINMKCVTRIACCVWAALALPTVANAQNVGPLVFGVVLPGILLGTIFSVVLKFGLLSFHRYRQVRPRLRGFIGIALADFAIWALALPSGLALRFGTRWVYKEYLPVALILAVAAGYVANYLAFHWAVARGTESVTVVSMALVLLLTLLMPLLIISFVLLIFLIFWIGSFISL